MLAAAVAGEPGVCPDEPLRAQREDGETGQAPSVPKVTKPTLKRVYDFFANPDNSRMKRKEYASDISREKFAQIEPLLRGVRKKCSKPTTVDLYEVFCAPISPERQFMPYA